MNSWITAAIGVAAALIGPIACSSSSDSSDCSKLAACCTSANFPSTEVSTCQASVSMATDSQCQMALSAYQMTNLCGGDGAGGDASVSITVPTPVIATPPSNANFPEGTAFGGVCDGDVYFPLGPGFAFCDNGAWSYTETDPSADGYTLDSTLEVDGGDAGE